MGAAAPSANSAAQHCRPFRHPRYSVRSAFVPSQLWFFCNGSRAQAGRAFTRGSSLGAASAPISTASSSPRNTNQCASPGAAQLTAGSYVGGLEKGSSMGGAEYNLRVPMDSRVTAKATDAELANSIRALAMDAVEAAKSGHPGMPMGMAEIAVALWKRHLHHNPANPAWPDRDRFILSNGHGSMLLYSLLHLTGYDLPIGELARFRQLGSKTPGHPERGCAPGVETTTGPLGQGISNAVGMALAERLLAAEFSRPGHTIVDHYTYAFMGDGCMMEGISHESCSLAGTLGLGKLIAVYDDNGISIDSDKGEKTRPTLICARTTIAKGAPTKANTGAAHGAALGAQEVAATRLAIGWPYPAFEVPQRVYDGWDAREAGKRAEKAWQRRFNAYAKEFPPEAAEFQRRMRGELPAGFAAVAQELLAAFNQKAETLATRRASQLALYV